MTTEELMKPRFKLIADYPGNSQPLGNITKEVATASYFRKFPSNFKELSWWEERDVKDMPEYVKYIPTGNIYKIEHIVLFVGVLADRGVKLRFTDCTPATLEEYQSLINKKEELIEKFNEVSERVGSTVKITLLESPSSSLEEENERLRATLKELVELKDVYDSGVVDDVNRLKEFADYMNRKPLAWQAARKLLKNE